MANQPSTTQRGRDQRGLPVGVTAAATGHDVTVGDLDCFTHGVASFDPTACSVLLWTRLGGGQRQASWLVAADPGLTEVVAHGVADTGPEHDGTITVDAVDLRPATTYWYRFDAGGQESPIGRTRTLPDGPFERFRIGTVCCAHFAEAPLGVYRALAEREVDLVVHLGDYSYEEAAPHGHRPHDPPHEAVTLRRLPPPDRPGAGRPGCPGAAPAPSDGRDVGRPRLLRQRVARRREAARSARHGPWSRAGRGGRAGAPRVAADPPAAPATTRSSRRDRWRSGTSPS